MHKVILASKSKVRKKILDKNKIKCKVFPSNIDEESVKKSLFLILSGTASVSRDSRVIANLHRPEFVGEISFITREPASANVDAKSKLYYIEWDQEELRRVKVKNPTFWTKLNQCLGEDLAKKIKHNSILKTEETEKVES